MNAANVPQHKIFHWKPSFVNKKLDEKGDSVIYLQKKYEKLWTMLSLGSNKKATKFVSVKLPLKIPKFQIFMTIEILRIHEYYITMINNNVTEWLASSGGIKFLETNRRNLHRTECLSDIFLQVYDEEIWHILQKFRVYKEPPSIASFTCCHHVATNKWMKKTFSEV